MNDKAKKQQVDSRMYDMPLRARRLVADAMAALAKRQVPGAERMLRDALALTPRHPEVQRLLAIALRLQNRNPEALTLLREAAARRPEDALIQNGLGSALDANGDAAGAIKAFRRACELAPDAPQLWSNLGKTLSDHGHFEEALPVLERAARMSGHPATHLRLADALRILGDTDAAMRRYRELITSNVADGTAWLGLAALKTRPFARADVDALRAALQYPQQTEDNRISLEFALAKAYDDNQAYAEAYAMLVRANARVRQIRPWNASAFGALTDAVRKAFGPSMKQATGTLGDDVIFIVSVPRSGSSLTEQILASHPRVTGAGELDDLTDVIKSESQRRKMPFPEWATTTDADGWLSLGRQYLERTQRWRKPGMMFTDKLPGNWLRLGAALAMLPGARVIECRRDPVETCFSCFRTLFRDGTQTFTYDLDDLASYWNDFDSLMKYWRNLYPERILVQDYESLVDDPETGIRRLLDYCGLSFDPACLQYHTTRRSVRTASASQVREPIRRNTTSAAKYGSLLDPLRAALKTSGA